MSGDLLVSMMEDFTRLFGPCPISPVEVDYVRRLDVARDARRQHVASVAPILAKRYEADDVRKADAFADVATMVRERHPALMQALKAKDGAEIGRLVLEAITPIIADAATEDAEDEAWDLFPDPEE